MRRLLKIIVVRGMNTDRELMQQALEKLEFFAHMKSVSEDTMRLITALRERLAQPEQEQVKFKCTVVDDANPNGVPLSQWECQSEQEPFCYHDGRNIVGKEFADHSDVFPLYTAPQPRQWQGLTDEEINSVRHNRDWTAHWTDATFARAIEAKLREKNHG